MTNYEKYYDAWHYELVWNESDNCKIKEFKDQLINTHKKKKTECDIDCVERIRRLFFWFKKEAKDSLECDEVEA